MDGSAQIWGRVLHKISTHISSATLNTWFKRVQLNKVNNGVAVISCADAFVREWIETKHKVLLTEAVTEVVGEKVSVTFIIDESFDTLKAENSPLFMGSKNTDQSIKVIQQANLNSKYVFEAFVVGPSNRLAHAAAEAISNKIGSLYNPFFVYGGVGLGKTHLMQAIGNRILQIDPKKRIFYCASERFLNEMVDAIRSGKTFEFRDKYRKLDLLIIDDIQFISNWQETQSELFHTFNELHLANKQIIFASDRPPAEIPNLMDRLRSRFEGGMVADISKPTFEMRVAILKKKAEENMIHLPEEIIITIASCVESNIRELEGALNRVYNQKNVTGVIPCEKDVKAMLRKIDDERRKSISPQKVIKEVAEEFEVKISEIKSSSRKARLSLPRQVAMYIIREDLHYKLEDTAKYLKRKDHTTVLNAIKKLDSMMGEDQVFREKVENLRDRVRRFIV